MDSICYLCGKKPAEDRDHIFPRNLFPEPRPANLPTVPSCRECNNSLSNDEEIFRSFIASGIAFETLSGYRIWTERIRPRLKKNTRGFKTLLRKLVKEVPVFSPNGNYLGTAPTLQPEQEKIDRVLKKISKGLYYLETGHPLPDDVCLLFQYVGEDLQKMLAPPFDNAIQGAERIDFGQNVVTYWRKTIEDNPTNSITWLVFYGVKGFIIVTYQENTIFEPYQQLK